MTHEPHQDGCKNTAWPCCEDKLCPCDLSQFHALLSEVSRLRNALAHTLGWLENREAYEASHFPHDPSPIKIVRDALGGGA